MYPIFGNEKLEFKQEYVEDINKEVIAFANAEGGIILIGIRKDGTVVGVDDPDETMLRVVNTLKDAIVPDIMPFVSVKTETEEGKNIVEITVTTGTNRPYYIREKGLKPSGVYVRKGSSTQPMTDEGIREMIRENTGRSFEEERSLEQELTFWTLRKEMEKRGYPLDIPQMRTLKLMGEDGLYKNLAYMLSDQFHSVIKIALFQGTDKAVFRDRKEFTGSVLQQLEEAYQYIDITNKTKAEFQGLERIDIRDYPQEAIREALLNTIVHRDYSYSGSNLINIYDDRIEFVSMGGLVGNLTLDSIFLGISETRNPNLANLFFRMNLIESYGTGIGKIQRSYYDNFKKPLFETAPGVFRVTLPNKNEQTDDEILVLRDSGSPGPKGKMPVSEKEKLLLYVKENGMITRKEAELVLNSGSTKAYQLLKELCEEKRLSQEGLGRSSRYVMR